MEAEGVRRALVVGGTSGLGLEIAKLLHRQGYGVDITGRNDPRIEGLHFIGYDIGTDSMEIEEGADLFCERLDDDEETEEPFDLVVYTAGYYQEGTICRLDPEEIAQMCAVGLLAPAIILSMIMRQQEHLPGFIAITSTSQWTPRKDEPVYTAVKAGLAMFAKSISFDDSIGKVLVAAPGGMKTPFWRKTGKDLSLMLDPAWVAEVILTLYENDEYKYRFVKILRNPARVEVEETRK